MSSVAGQTEYAFWHAVVRDVAYAQIPRAGRMRRHQAAAEWLEHLAGERLTDRAEIIAHHYSQAVALARATDQQEERLAVLKGTRPPLPGPGRRPGPSALTYPRRRRTTSAPSNCALAITPSVLGSGGDGEGSLQAGRMEDAARAYHEAIDGFARHGDVLGQGEARIGFVPSSGNQGETGRSRAVRSRLSSCWSPRGQPTVVLSYAQMAADRVLSGHSEEARHGRTRR